jgi:hypothetical protein
MSRRHQLKVDTFPFLAVLLCAMGSLILVLLVMDRRSKLAARQRAAEQVRRQAEDHAAAASRRRDEYEGKKRAQQAAWNRKRDVLRSRVSAEESALDAELRDVQAQLAEVAKKLRQEEEKVRELRGQLKDEQARLASRERSLDGAREESRALAGKLGEADKARAKLAEDLAQLETLLAAMKQARDRDAHTYSVIPYKGKRGDDRRPIYVECSEAGMVFHPDKTKLDAPSPESLVAELKKRVARQAEELAAEGVTDARPYVMLLVRPNGVMRHYEMQAAAKELRIDFGYEFVDAEWEFSIPKTESPTSAQVAKASPSSKVPRLPAIPVGGVGGGVAATPVSRHGGGVAGAAGGGGGPALSGLPDPSRGSPLPGIGLSPPQPYSASTKGSAAATHRPPLPTPDGPMVSMHRPVARKAEGASEGLELPSILPAPVGPTRPAGPAPTAEATTPSNGAEQSPSAAPRGGAEQGAAPGARPGFAGPQPAGQPAPMRPARVSEPGDTVIYIECRPDTVVVYPARKQIGIDSLNHTPPHNPLTQTVNQVIARQQALARNGGSPARFHVRFLIHPGCERAYHRAYPALETVPAPKSSYRLMADDDVARIVAGF